MRIVLIQPPFEGKTFMVSRPPFPYGLLHLGTILSNAGHDVTIYNLSLPPTKRIIPRPERMNIRETRYYRFGWSDRSISHRAIMEWQGVDLFGVTSLMSSCYNGAYRVIEILKKHCPRTPVVIGGPHVTINPQHVEKYCEADYLAYGECDFEFLKWIETGESDHIVRRQIIPYGPAVVEDLNKLPILYPGILHNAKKYDFTEIYMQWTRGCPHNCSFCSNKQISAQHWRAKKPEVVLDEMAEWMGFYGTKTFILEDDNLAPPGKGIRWLKEVCKAIIDSNMKPKLRVSHGIPVYATADKELVELMHEAGFRKFALPLESSNKAVLKDMRKANTVDNWRKSVHNIKAIGEKHPPTEIIIGYPFVETIETMLQTIMDIAAEGAIAWGSHFRLNHGMGLWKRCIKAGYIRKGWDPINAQNTATMETERFNTQDLREIMAISRAANWGVENGINVFKDDPMSAPKDFKWGILINGVLAEGKFKYKREQNVFAGIMFMRKVQQNKRPVVVYKDGKQLVLRKWADSRVYSTLAKMLFNREGIRSQVA